MKTPRADWQAVAAAQRRGFSLFELGVVLVVIAVLGTVFLQRVLFYQEEAERAAVAQVLAQLRITIQSRVAEAHIRGRTGDLSSLAGENPMSWLLRPPGNYEGEREAPQLDELEAGSWYFDRAEKTLLYLPAQYDFFSNEKRHPLKFRLLANTGNAPETTGKPENKGLSLEQVVDK
ncbi:type II secretion system protein [Pseudoduganella violacea]|uniref:General secretion pathway protein G n=1 Tax=Pseudoduganella violacea TaxID=1715466 RepID=A0A7W5FVP7_9BURK|nr:type II secretion system protein [Pseudoduganella violacea]MBB3121235.1 general secretion pathway protein G [Pseudoduganella violacea]